MGVLHLFFALERHKIIFLLRWKILMQERLQNERHGVRGLRMVVAIAGAAGLVWCGAIVGLRCGAGVAGWLLRLRSEFR